ERVCANRARGPQGVTEILSQRGAALAASVLMTNRLTCIVVVLLGGCASDPPSTFAYVEQHGLLVMDDIAAPGTPLDKVSIFSIDVDGTHAEQITLFSDPDYPDGNASAISPDESMIAIYTGVESHPDDTPLTWGHRNIGFVGPHGGARTLLTACHPVATQQE